ncbi:MAG: response regulator transcription factor [Anaerolineae bacterium]|jgi:DNA-binding response OmpR family regulator|nr:response regulator transcription factor [Anaerolineae bacterium]MBT7191595.1 response regulator transcription factor [Anaerolineae bacterium]
MPRILIVDDEHLIVDSLTYSLRQEGFEVKAVEDGQSALAIVPEFHPDVIVLDIMLPDINGREVCRRLRSFSTVPVIMLTARSDEIDRVLGLEVGADDYLVKPFSFRELLARIQAILRRVALDQQIDTSKLIQAGPLQLDIVARRVFKDDQEIQVSAREFDLLTILMTNMGQAMSRSNLINKVWGIDWVGETRTLDVHIRWLRLKIEADPASPKFIRTVRGYGYRFAGAEELE